MLHLVLALASVAPTQTFVLPQAQPGLPAHLLQVPEYRPFLDVPTKDLHAMRAGDFLILPNRARCPTKLVSSGVKVYIWRLGSWGGLELTRRQSMGGCRHFSHTFWLTENLIDTPLPRSHFISWPMLSMNVLSQC